MITNRPQASKALRLGEVFCKLQRTMGGSSDTELKELAVSPSGLLLPSVHETMVTPVPKEPKAARSAFLSNKLLVLM